VLKRVVFEVTKKSKEILGHIKVTGSPTFISKRNKYIVEVRSYSLINHLEYDNFEIFNNFVDILKKRKLKRGRGQCGKIIEQMDKEDGNTFYHYLFYVSCDKEYEVEDIAQCLESHLERNEECKIQSTYGERIKLWPWERDKAIATIPITQKMIDNIVEKRKRGSTNE